MRNTGVVAGFLCQDQSHSREVMRQKERQGRAHTRRSYSRPPPTTTTTTLTTSCTPFIIPSHFTHARNRDRVQFGSVSHQPTLSPPPSPPSAPARPPVHHHPSISIITLTTTTTSTTSTTLKSSSGLVCLFVSLLLSMRQPAPHRLSLSLYLSVLLFSGTVPWPTNFGILHDHGSPRALHSFLCYQPAGRESRFSTRAPTLTNIRISQFYAAGNHFPLFSRSNLSPAMSRRIYSAQYSHC
jgi:hypothetical protein